MRDFRIVFNYELRQQLSKRTVQVTTLILIILALVGTSIPRISAMFSSGGDGQDAKADTTLTEQVGYVFADDVQRADYTSLLGLEGSNYYASRDDLVTALKDDSLVGFMFTDTSLKPSI